MIYATISGESGRDYLVRHNDQKLDDRGRLVTVNAEDFGAFNGDDIVDQREATSRVGVLILFCGKRLSAHGDGYVLPTKDASRCQSRNMVPKNHDGP